MKSLWSMKNAFISSRNPQKFLKEVDSIENRAQKTPKLGQQKHILFEA
jgi:hypothetical protein